MSHTSEEASKLWCPMVRLAASEIGGQVSSGQTVFNRLSENSALRLPKGTECVSVNCALWRVDSDDKTKGYCGMGGKP